MQINLSNGCIFPAGPLNEHVVCEVLNRAGEQVPCSHRIPKKLYATNNSGSSRSICITKTGAGFT